MKLFLGLLMTMMIGGCSTTSLLQSSEPQQTIYTLRAAAPAVKKSGQSARILEIAKPSVPPGFHSDRIALYTQNGQKLDYFAGALWSASLPDVVQNFTRLSASSILPYIVSVTPEQSINADYRVQVKINDLEPVYDANISGTPVLKAAVEFTLIRLPDETIVSSFTLSKDRPAESNRLDSITLGLEGMLQDIYKTAFEKLDTQLKSKAR